MGAEGVERAGAGGVTPEDRAQAWAAYRALNDSAIQQRLRARRQWFCGAAYGQPGDYELDEVRRELRRMRELGFNVVRLRACDPVELEPGRIDFRRADDWMNTAAEVGMQALAQFPFGQPGHRVLSHHGLTLEEFYELGFADPMVLRIVEGFLRPVVERYRAHPALLGWVVGDIGAGAREPKAVVPSMMRDLPKKRFAAWLRQRYRALEEVDRAWKVYPEQGKLVLGSFDDAWRVVKDLEGKAGGAGTNGGAGPAGNGAGTPLMAEGILRDLLRFETDQGLVRTRGLVGLIRRFDPLHPVAIESRELLASSPGLRRDLFAHARCGDAHCTSLRLSKACDLWRDEYSLPAFIQARLTHDSFKGGWTGVYDMSAGPVVTPDGGGHSMSPGLMRRLMLANLSAGNVNMAFQAWNTHLGGAEGEFGLTTLSGAVSAWAVEAGKVARAVQRYIGELWEGVQDIQVGILCDWDNEASAWVDRPNGRCCGTGGGAGDRDEPLARAYAGAARALLNGRVGFEFLAAPEIAEGIGLCYPAIYVPHMSAMSDDLILKLRDYVERGGRLVADVWFGFADPWGKARKTGPDGQVAQLFGAFVDALHEGAEGEMTYGGAAVRGVYGDLVATEGRVTGAFGDGRPAMTERTLGRGTATLVGFDLAAFCGRPGNLAMEGVLRGTVGGTARWQCNAPAAMRLLTPRADHYFLLNDGAARTVLIEAERAYSRAEDVIEGMTVEGGRTIKVELSAGSALWLRLAY